MEETRPKVLALYEAVLKLLDEGADINTLKVSDMTERAGIGKGTAYDYFKSKEEIIAAAVVFDVERKVRTERMRLEQYADFESKIRYCFRWTLQELQEQKAFMRFLYLSSYSCSLKKQIFEEVKKRRKENCGPVQILKDLSREGKREGVVRAELSEDAAAYLMLASLMSFVLYLEHREKEAEEEAGQMMEILCEGLLAQLR